MALPTTGQIAISNFRSEFILSSEVKFSDLYKNGTYISGISVNNENVPSANTIALSNMRGIVNAFIYTQTLSANTDRYFLKDNLISAGYPVFYANGATRPAAAQITINAGVYLFCGANVNDVFSVGRSITDSVTYPASSSCLLINNGIMAAKGGQGGEGKNRLNDDGLSFAQVSGKTGFRALAGRTEATNTNMRLFLTNNGTIAGGGGGGGGTSGDGGTRGVGGGGGRALAESGPNGVAQSNEGTRAPSATLESAGPAGTDGTAGGGAGGDFGQNGQDSFGGNAVGVGGAAGVAIFVNNRITIRTQGTVLGAIT